jgi:hypothetical protein
MKEWQRWEAMAGDFARMGDHRREAECLDMALEILPPGHGEDKTRLSTGLERARTIVTEEGLEATRPEVADDLEGDLLEELEAMGPEDARQAVLQVVRRMCTTIEGAPEAQVIKETVASTGVEEALVSEALEELVDEGSAYRGRPGRIMVDGIVDEPDVETAVLGMLGQLSTGGRGAAREDVVGTLVERGFIRDEVLEAIDELEESGRLDEAHQGQLRSALDMADIREVHHLVYAALEEMDTDGTGVLDARLERELTSRGVELEEARQALDDLVDEGEVIRDGGEVRVSRPGVSDREAKEQMLEVVHALSEDRGRPVPLITVLRAARSRGLPATSTRRAMDALVDEGVLWRDDRGVHLMGEGEADPATARDAVLAALRQLADGHGMGASAVEVIDLAVSRGLGEQEARETLDDLVDDGLVHDAGGGFLRPG